MFYQNADTFDYSPDNPCNDTAEREAQATVITIEKQCTPEVVAAIAADQSDGTIDDFSDLQFAVVEHLKKGLSQDEIDGVNWVSSFNDIAEDCIRAWFKERAKAIIAQYPTPFRITGANISFTQDGCEFILDCEGVFELQYELTVTDTVFHIVFQPYLIEGVKATPEAINKLGNNIYNILCTSKNTRV